jgi:beta-1,3-galactosyltransferase 1
MSAIQWTATNCPHVRYVLKTDDDIFINIFTLVHNIEGLRSKGDINNIFACHVWPISKPKRTGKYNVSSKEFAGEYYPQFCSGSAYLMSSDVISSLASVIGSVKPLKLEDVHITGFLRQQANLTLRYWNEAYLLYDEQFNPFLGANWQNFLFSHVHNNQLFKEVWQKLEAKALKIYSPDMRTIINN